MVGARLIGTVLIVSVLLVAGCGASEPPGDAGRIDAKLVAGLTPDDARAVSQAVNDFGFDLFREVADGERNTIMSPLSVTALLAMILAGADGATAAEMTKALGLAGRRDVRLGALLGKLAGGDEVTLSVANSLWADAGTPFHEEYQNFVRDTFGATVDETELGSPEAARKIDDWVDENTGGRIDGIAKDLGLPDPNAVLVLLNAVYFLGEWTTKFDKAVPEPFAAGGGAAVDVPTMHLRRGSFGYAQRDGYRMLRLPYGEDGRYGMEVLLPDEGRTLPQLLASLDAAEWRAATGALAPRTVADVALPRFELRWQDRLNEPLQRLGITTAFTPAADFGSMSPRAPVLGRVVQKTYVRVDENGTEAAAVSGGAMVTSAQVPLEFRADRPFAFTISDRDTGAVLFLGAVTDPRQ